MGIFSRFENRMEDTFEGAAGAMSNAPIAPVQIFKKAEKQMKRGVMVGAGKEFAPTLYTVLINEDDDQRMFGYYPTLAGEAETYLENKAAQEGLIMDGHPLVRFVVDENLKHGKFEIIAEMVAGPIVSQLRQEEMVRYGLAVPAQPYANGPWAGYDVAPDPDQPQRKPPLPYVPEEEIDRSIDYGEYTFNSEDFEGYSQRNSQPLPGSEAPQTPVYEQPQAYEPEPIFEPEPAAYQPQPAYQPEPAYEPQAYQQQQPIYQQPVYQQPVYQQPAYLQQQARTPQNNTVVYAGSQPAGAAAPMPAPAQGVRARIVNVAYRRAYDLAGTHITIGRETGNDIMIQDINASRRHAELNLSMQGIWTITDLGSMNGTIVNGQRVATLPLHAGDIITIGKTDLEFTLL